MSELERHSLQLVSEWDDDADPTMNPDDLTLDNYLQVMQRSAVARYAYSSLQSNVRRRLGGYTHEDTRIEEWVNFEVLPAAMQAVGGLLSAVPYGNVLAEPVWVPGDGAIRLHRVKVAHPTIWWDGEVERDELFDVVRWTRFGDPAIELYNAARVRQIVQWSRGGDFDNAWGDPALRRIYPAYKLLANYIKWEGIGSETHAIPRTIIRHNGDTDEGDAYVTAFNELGANAAVALPAGSVTDITELSGKFTGDAFDTQIRRVTGWIFMCFNLTMLPHMESQYGTRAQADTQAETEDAPEVLLTKDLAEQVLEDQIIRPGIEMQFGQNVPAGALSVIETDPPTLASWAAILQQLWSMGVVDATSEEFLTWLGERFDLPMAEPGMLPESAEAETRPVVTVPRVAEEEPSE